MQQAVAFGALGAAAACAIGFWSYGPALALGASALCLLGYSALLAIEFVLMHHVNRSDAAPRARLSELFSAWWAETRVAAQVFSWRQPFRPNAVPDQCDGPALKGQRGVVFIHGLLCNRGFWSPWLRRLQGSRHAFVALSLEPAFGAIDNYVEQIEAAVQRVSQASGLPPLLVCHSMGGLAARAWLRSPGHLARIHRVVTLGTPHQGTWLARFGRSPNGKQMRQGSGWLERLSASARQEEKSAMAERFTCWYSNCDNIVFPTSTAMLHGADNRFVRGVAHVQLAFLPEVMHATLALLEQPPQTWATGTERSLSCQPR